MAESSLLKSIFGLTCPRCRKGRQFVEPFSFQNAYRMYERCPVCDLKYEREPGYFYGAMFVSYGLTGWLFIIIGLALVFGLGWTLSSTLVTIAIIAIATHSFAYRLSRSIWMHLFVKYEASATS